MKNLKTECSDCYKEIIRMAENVDDFIQQIHHRHDDTVSLLGLANAALFASFQEFIQDNNPIFLEIVLAIEKLYESRTPFIESTRKLVQDNIIKELEKYKKEEWAEVIQEKE